MFSSPSVPVKTSSHCATKSHQHTLWPEMISFSRFWPVAIAFQCKFCPFVFWPMLGIPGFRQLRKQIGSKVEMLWKLNRNRDKCAEEWCKCRPNVELNGAQSSHLRKISWIPGLKDYLNSHFSLIELEHALWNSRLGKRQTSDLNLGKIG